MASLIEIPNKSLFKLNEVCSLTGVKPYVLRFWEAEFDEVNPITSSSGQKLYEHKDIEAVAVIKKLLFEDKLNIEKAKADIKILLSANENYGHLDNDDDEEEINSLPQIIRQGLSRDDLNKLEMAKKDLQTLMSLTTEIQERHQWLDL